MSIELATMSASEASGLFAAGKLSPVELTKAIVDNVTTLNPHINAFCWLDTEGALKAAHESEERWRRGAPLSRLDGITFTIKDLSVSRGWPTRRACLAIRSDGPWEEDSPSVARMREAGAVALGKTTVPEFGAASFTHSALCGTTHNPWNLETTPGGSSGGAAASVIAGMGTIALGSDAAGSIRLPASMSGVFGLKTTFARVPDYPSSYLGSFAVIGPMTRTVEDASLCMDVITRHDPRDSHGLPPETSAEQARGGGLAGVRILYSPTFGFARVDPELAAIVRRGVERMAALGAIVEEADIVMDDPSDILWTVMAARMAHAFEIFKFTDADLALMNPRLVASVERGRKAGLLPYVEACRQCELFGARMHKLHEKYDLLVTPSVAVPSGGLTSDEVDQARYPGITDRSPFVRPFNISKQPAASVPIGVTADGAPVGMQVVGPLYGDRAVLRACAAYEAAYPFAEPDLSAIARRTPSQTIPKGIQSMLDAISQRD